MMRDSPVLYVGVDRVDDPLIFVSGVHGVGLEETVEVLDEEIRSALSKRKPIE